LGGEYDECEVHALIKACAAPRGKSLILGGSGLVRALLIPKRIGGVFQIGTASRSGSMGTE
jgi:hypothetical protein